LPFGEADAEYAAVLELDPQNAEIHVQRARFLRDHKREKEAAAAFRQAIALRESEEEYSTAADWLGDSARSRPEFPPALPGRPNCSLRQNRKKRRAPVFIEAGEGLLEQQNLAEGVGALLRALEIRPDDEALLERVASLYEESGSTDPAVELYRRLANLRESKEDYEGAVRGAA
jgi:Tfp pilus assembly protein PilF